MAKSLQDQMLALGLTNQKKAKKNAKEMKKTAHAKRTGNDEGLEDTAAEAEAARKDKAARDKELNRQRDDAAKLKAIAAQIKQLISSNAVDAAGDIKYNFVHDKKVKQMYVNQAVWDRLSRGQLAIILLEVVKEEAVYKVVPLQVAEKIRERGPDHFIMIADASGDVMDEDDPYAAYQIPDDLMW
ncbi:DUF2058 domain-containing protein [Oceanobacter mangrovi]|uniref:DUF2058 domain-containing protein n=1 Tax=Oceanobacter mangrovi TaxID=2862510 RepID=UPI001C8DF66C|nr:DUF2058 domain-containing protein [Oceanobacter mangrovi]